MAITRNLVVMLKDDVAKPKEKMFVYRDDVGVEMVIELKDFDYSIDTVGNRNNIQKAYALFRTPTKKTYQYTNIKISNGKLVFTFSQDIVNVMQEIGEYELQFQLYDKEDNRLTIPSYNFYVKEPLTIDGELVDTAVVDESVVVDLGEEKDYIFVITDGYIKTKWRTGDLITKERLNKVENALSVITDAVNSKVGISQLHNHKNKEILDTISANKINEWDNKSNFNGDYNSLTNKPTIPTKVSDLQNDSGYLTEHQDISGKVDKVDGHSLVSDTEISRLATLENYDDTEIHKSINEINTSLDNMEQQKATKQEIEIERKRIDNLAKLEEGSTSGDAELIDGRVTYFGETSDNIGGAIRSQIGYLTSNLMERTDNLINVNTLHVGKSFNTSTLQYQNSSNWVSSNFIEVEPNTQYQFSCNNGLQLTNKAIGINSDKSVATVLSISAGKFTTAEDTKYVIIATNNATTVANYNTWMLVKGNYKGTYIPYHKPKYEDIIKQLYERSQNKNSIEHKLFSPKKYRYFMHRGFSYFSQGNNPELSAPENSIPAFENAGVIGADGIETDICETSDGHFVCMHDKEVDRTTNGTGNVIDMTLSEIRNLNIDYGANLEKYSNLQVPTLDEYLEICIKYGCIPVIEIKNIVNYQKLYSLLEYYGVIDNCIIICTQTGSIDKIREISDSILICKNVYSNENYVDKIEEYSKYNNIMIQFQKGEQLTKEIIQQCHEKGIICGLWTINYQSQQKTYGLGVDYAIVDMLPLKP